MKVTRVAFTVSAVYLAYAVMDTESVPAPNVTVTTLDRADGRTLDRRVFGQVLYGWFDLQAVEGVGLLFRGTVGNAQYPSRWLAMMPL